jgi:hypothetical protein
MSKPIDFCAKPHPTEVLIRVSRQAIKIVTTPQNVPVREPGKLIVLNRQGGGTSKQTRNSEARSQSAVSDLDSLAAVLGLWFGQAS